MALAIQPVSTTPTLADLKLRLNKTLTVDDAELQSMLDAALDEYRRRGFAVGTGTAYVRADGPVIILPKNAAAVLAAADENGTALDLTASRFDADTGLLHWTYAAGPHLFWDWGYGTRRIVVTYEVAIPAAHVEAILADVAGYFAATQRGGGSQSRRFPGEGYAEAYEAPGTPLTLFPRIKALAESSPSIA